MMEETVLEVSMLRSTGVLFLSALLCFGASCSSTPAAVPVKKLRIGVVPFAGWAALDVGIEKGFYKEFGVDLETVVYDGEDAKLIDDTIEGRNVDVGMYSVGTFQEPAQKGKRVKWLGETDWSFGADQLIGRDPFQVDEIRAKTKKIGLYSKTAATGFFVERYLSDTEIHPAWTLSLKNTEVVEEAAEKMVESFAKGELGLSLNYEPYSKDQLAAGGKLLATSRSYPGVIPNGVAMNEDRYAAMDKATLIGFWKGWIKSVNWIFGKTNTNGLPDPANRAEFYRILRERTLKTKFANSAQYTDQDLAGFLDNAPALRFNDLAKIHTDKRTDIKILEYKTKGTQPLTSHIAELSQFVRDTNPDAKEIDAVRFYDGKEIEAAIAASK
jgi:NitT/TauT family transport system substrate-binding protein